MSTSRDSTEEEREGAETMSIDPKPSNVSIASATKLTVNTAPEAESRDDSGASERTAPTGASDERQGAAPVAAPVTKKTAKVPPKKRNTAKALAQARSQDSRQGHYPQSRNGPIPYHTQVLGNGPRGPPYGGPPTYGYGGPGGPPSHDLYRGPHQYSMPPMPHQQQGYGGPGPGAPFGHPGQHHHPNYGGGPYSHHPPPHMYSYQGAPIHQQRPPISSFTSSSDDTASLGSSKSKGSKSGKCTSSNSRKKRTIDGVDQRLNVAVPQHGLSSAFSMRRVHSNASTSSTVTAGNNTSTDTPNLTDDSPQKQRPHLPPLSSRPDYQGSIAMLEDAHKQGYHRRDFSGASTTSSLSVGGLSLSSYETRGMY